MRPEGGNRPRQSAQIVAGPLFARLKFRDDEPTLADFGFSKPFRQCDKRCVHETDVGVRIDIH